MVRDKVQIKFSILGGDSMKVSLRKGIGWVSDIGGLKYPRCQGSIKVAIGNMVSLARRSDGIGVQLKGRMRISLGDWRSVIEVDVGLRTVDGWILHTC